jgi:hypothetical protein
MRRRSWLCTAVCAAAFMSVVPGTALGATTIDTTSSWDGVSCVWPFGYLNTATFGQVVTVPSRDTRLDSFTFYIKNDDTPPGGTSSTIVLRGEVYAWDGTKASGRGLWESAPRSLTVSGPFEEVSFDTGGLRLKARRTYVLFASVSKDFDDNPGGPTGYEHQTCWGYTFANSYAGGGWVFQNNGDDVSQWTGSPWETFEDGTDDLAFKAEFSARGRSDKHLAR